MLWIGFINPIFSKKKKKKNTKPFPKFKNLNAKTCENFKKKKKKKKGFSYITHLVIVLLMQVKIKFPQWEFVMNSFLIT